MFLHLFTCTVNDENAIIMNDTHIEMEFYFDFWENFSNWCHAAGGLLSIWRPILGGCFDGKAIENRSMDRID